MLILLQEGKLLRGRGVPHSSVISCRLQRSPGHAGDVSVVGVGWGYPDLVPSFAKLGSSPVLYVPSSGPVFRSAFSGLRCPLLTTEGRTMPVVGLGVGLGQRGRG